MCLPVYNNHVTTYTQTTLRLGTIARVEANNEGKGGRRQLEMNPSEN